MHHYLKAIGFGELETKKELYDVLEDVQQFYTSHELVYMEEEMDYCEYQKEYGSGFGIIIHGDLDIFECFKKQYYFPYFSGSGISSYAEVHLEKRMDKDAFIGICDDPRIGVNLVFHLQNTLEYMRECQAKKGAIGYTSVTLSGLCNEGMILLPLMKDKEQKKAQQEKLKNRVSLVSAVKSGDVRAMESLAMEDMDIYSQVSRRIGKDDILTIVDTYIMPQGFECDRYAILGEILEFGKTENEYSGEQVYIMKINVNGLVFDILVPEAGLVGEPEVGRRIKANMWLQGRINF